MALHRMVARLFLSTVMILFVSARLAISQTEDPLSIRVESNLVLVNTEVYYQERMHQLTNDLMRCKRANTILFYQLRASEPFFPKSCYEMVIQGLRASDFHIFEDGIEQKIERVKLDHWPVNTVRDNLGVHAEWSHTARGKWSNVDYKQPMEPAMSLHFYQIAYVPTKSEKGECHHVKVTVDRPNAIVLARDEYCYTEHPVSDPLNGTNFGKRVEADLDSDKSGKIPLSLQANVFYTGAQKAQVDVVLEFPPDHLKHEWIRLDFRAMIGVVGVIHRRNESLVARFSDIGCCVPGDLSQVVVAYDPDAYSYPSEYDNRDELVRIILPSRYETQIEVPAGEEYDLQVVLSDGKTFGRAKTRLNIGGYDGTQFAISSVALSNRFRDAGAAAKEAAAVHLAPGYVPLVSRGIQVTPTTDTKFKSGEPLIAYYEIYEPLLSQEPKTTVQVNMKIVDAKSGETKVTFPPLDSEPYKQPGQTTIAIGNELKIGKLRKGDYRLEVQATDSAGRSTPLRTAIFTIE
jgi:hypothetical protein